MSSFIAALTIILLCMSRCGQAQRTQQPHAVVAQDGTGNFRTIMAAISAAPNNSRTGHVIKIKQGTYDEYVQIAEHKTNIVLIGEGMGKTVISGNKSYGDGIRTYFTATVGVNGQGFMAQDITFRNAANKTKSQAVALRAEADFCTFYRCGFEGYQDTLYTKRGKQFYRDCSIYGTIDFICGEGTAIFQNCLIEVRKPVRGQFTVITAQKREVKKEQSGIVFQNCTVTASQELRQADYNVTTYLGRPWGVSSRTIVMDSYLDRLIDRKGWTTWNNDTSRTPFYMEYNNRGPGAVINGRVKWASVTKDANIASKFTVRNFISGDKWIPSGVPHYLDLV